MNAPLKTLLLAASCAAIFSHSAFAAVSAEEAAKLKTSLTPMGAERAGNADGSIPEWKGGYTTVPAGWKNGDPRPDPFAGEKPLYTVTAANMDKYADKLSDGVKALFKRFPDFRLNVYPTHRTAAAPQWLYDNTFKNATRASLTDGGYGVQGAYGGVPFPIPKDGYEVFWNARLAWEGDVTSFENNCWVVTTDGKRTLSSAGRLSWKWPYYDQNGSPESFKGYYNYGLNVKSEPVSVVGETILVHENLNESSPRNIWQYLVGQRRVRKAPSVAYDTPDTVTSGTGLFDEAFGSFGPFARHDYKLVGKKEVLVPYNNNGAYLVPVDDLVKPGFLNPEHVRWELHRVWVVEAELLPGKRHTMPKRRYYIDEDSWHFLLADHWDAQGELYHMYFALTYLVPDLPALVKQTNWGIVNMLTGQYYLNTNFNGMKTHFPLPKDMPDSAFTPDAIASGAR